MTLRHRWTHAASCGGVLSLVLLSTVLTACTWPSPAPTAAATTGLRVTETPSPTPTATPTPIPTPTATPTPLPSSVLLEPMNHQQQTYNNCGPASAAIILGYYDHWITQGEVNRHLRPGPSPCGIISYLSRFGLRGRVYRMSLNCDPIRLLLANGIPVIANQGLTLTNRLGHYRVIHGYDDAVDELISDDPLLGTGLRIECVDYLRLGYRRPFIAVYPPDREALVESLMEASRVREIACPR